MSRPLTTELEVRPAVTVLEDRLTPSATVDLTQAGATGTINGAVFMQYDARPTGTGHIQSFVRIQGASAHSAVTQGYNTDARPLQYDENKSPQFTRGLALSQIPVVNIGGVPSYEFLLDINQNSKQPLLSLDDVKMFVGDQPDLKGFDPSQGKLAGLSPVYDMNAGGDHWVLLNYRLNTGSGSGDMLMYVPASWFNTGSATPYVYLYSKFGVNDSANAGFQEWATSNAPLNPALSAISGQVVLSQSVEGAPVVTPLGGVFVFADFNSNGTFDQGDLGMVTNPDGTFTFSNILVTAHTEVNVIAQPNLGLDTPTYFAPNGDPVVSQLAVFDPGQSVQFVDPFTFLT